MLLTEKLKGKNHKITEDDYNKLFDRNLNYSYEVIIVSKEKC